jgi:hypothetical protein
MPVFEGEDGAYEPVEMGLYKPYEVVVKFNAEDYSKGIGGCGQDPSIVSESHCKECGWYWDGSRCHGSAPMHQDFFNPGEQSTAAVATPWYTQEVVPNVPNWLLAGVGVVVLIGYFMFRKKEG